MSNDNITLTTQVFSELPIFLYQCKTTFQQDTPSEITLYYFYLRIRKLNMSKTVNFVETCKYVLKYPESKEWFCY